MNKLRVTLIRSRYGRFVSPLAPIHASFQICSTQPPFSLLPTLQEPSADAGDPLRGPHQDPPEPGGERYAVNAWQPDQNRPSHSSGASHTRPRVIVDIN